MYLVVGCGFLGSYLLKHITENTDEKVIATVRDLKNAPDIDNVEFFKCDMTDLGDFYRLANRIKNESLKVFFLVAVHNIDLVHKYPDEAFSVNFKTVKMFIDIIPNIEKFFFASTDCVYGEGKGIKEKFTEEDELKPINDYGFQKRYVEGFVLENGYTVLRLPFMLGPSLMPTRKHFYDNIKASLQSGKEIEMIDGFERSVLSYSQAAKIIFELSQFETELPQTINVCGDKAYTKYDVGCVLAKKFGADLSLVKRISEQEGKKFFKDKRAHSTVMDNTLLKELLGKEEIIWEEDICC